MALEFPWQAFMQAQQQKNQNRQQAMQDAEGIGQNFGQLGQNIIGQRQEAQKKAAWQKTINEMLQNPNLPTQLKAMIPAFAQQPSLIGQIGPELLKTANTKPTSPWRVVSGMLAKSGKPIQQNEQTGEVREVGLDAKPSGGAFGGMADVRRSQNIMSDLPSRSNPNTAAGAAYMVKVASRQGKALIGKPGSPQQISLAASDLARAVQRSAPQLETLQGSSFSNNIVTQVNQLTQKLTADPQGKDVPKIRKQIYDLLDDLDKTAQPWIENQLKTTEDVWSGSLPKNWEMIKKRELGQNVPDVPFLEGIGPKPIQGVPQVGSLFNGQKIVSVEPL